MEPDPECRWCRGTGEVALFTSVVACECIFMSRPEGIREPRVDMNIGWGHGQDEYGGAD